MLFLVQASALLLFALLCGRLAALVGLPPVVGELFAGVLLGPSVLGMLAPDISGWLFPSGVESAPVDGVGQVGVLLLVGLSGCYVNVRGIRRSGSATACVSLAGLAVPLGLGVAVAHILPTTALSATSDHTAFALLLGVAMCVSSIPVLARTLMDLRLLQSGLGQLTLVAALVDDAAGWLILSLVSATAVSGIHGVDVVLPVAAAILAVTCVVAVGPLVVRKLFALARRRDDGTATVALMGVVVLLGAATTHAMGLGEVLGAFVAGVLIGSYAGLEAEQFSALRTVVVGILAPLFLATAGLRMDITTLASPPALVSAVAILGVAIAGKFAGAYVGARLGRLGHWEATAVGAGMNARGVIEVVIALVGLRLGVFTSMTYTIVVLLAVVTSVMAPPLLRMAARRVEETAEGVRVTASDPTDGRARVGAGQDQMP